jgi:hypothetical protein
VTSAIGRAWTSIPTSRPMGQARSHGGGGDCRAVWAGRQGAFVVTRRAQGRVGAICATTPSAPSRTAPKKPRKPDPHCLDVPLVIPVLACSFLASARPRTPPRQRAAQTLRPVHGGFPWQSRTAHGTSRSSPCRPRPRMTPSTRGAGRSGRARRRARPRRSVRCIRLRDARGGLTRRRPGVCALCACAAGAGR